MITDGVGLPSLQIAALLHDIGKFWQRTGERHGAKFDLFDAKDYGAHGAHAKWSADFLERCVPSAWRGNSYDVLSHHVPKDRRAKIIALADRLSSAERRDKEPDREASFELLSIFSQVQGTDARAPGGSYFYPLGKLSLRREVLFPRAGPLPEADLDQSYAKLWADFLEEVGQLPGAAFEPYFVSLYHLLQKYTWCMPSAGYVNDPDVSLYDHARTTCAIATCLWLADVAEEELDALLARRAENRRQPRFLLISGDISGVQSFLYTITSKGAARGLRGRSFYLQLLGEAAADYLLSALGLSIANLLYVGGGRFFILAPLSAGEALEKAKMEIAHAMLKVHCGDLYLAVGAAPLAPDDFLPGKFAEKWREASRAADGEKRRKMADIARDAYGEVFGPRGTGGPVSTGSECDVCGKSIADQGDVTGGVLSCPDCAGEQPPSDRPVPVKICDVCLEEVSEGQVSGGALKCQDCADFEKLGAEVAGATGQILCRHGEVPDKRASQWQWKLWQVGRAWYSFSSEAPNGCLSHTIGDSDFLQRGCHGFRFLASVTPVAKQDRPYRKGGEERTIRRGEVKEFSLLAGDAVGVQRLGVLRMDVDDLGPLFQRGLGDHATVSRVSSLSFHLRTFFEGWLNEVCNVIQRDEQGVLESDRPKLEEDRLYVIYSGGDDLFVVGAWDRLPLLAEAISADLKSFAAGNPSLHISAGVVLAAEHFPLYQAAEAAHEALDGKAKRFTRADGRKKDAICFLDTALGWEDFSKVKDLAFAVQRLVGEGVPDGARRKTVPKALITSLSAIHREYEGNRQQHPGVPVNGQDRVYYGRWMWLAAYNLCRLVERLRSPGQALERDVKAIQKELTNPKVVENLGLIARWAELLVREGKEESR